MDTHDQDKHMAAATRRGRGFLFWLGRIALVLLGLITLGMMYESIAEAADARAYPPPAS